MSKSGDKRKASTGVDDMFNFSATPLWYTKKNVVLGSDLIVHNPTVTQIPEVPKQIQFELSDKDEFWSLGPYTRFRIQGTFQICKPAKGEAPAEDWKPCVTADLLKTVVQPNWFEQMLKGVEMYHGNTVVYSSDEGRHVFAWLNTWKYFFMDPEQKQLLLPQPCHPGYGIPSLAGATGWSATAGSEWEKIGGYGREVFKNSAITFDWIPLDFAPLFQGTNYMDGSTPRVLPMPLLDKLTIRFLFNEDLSCIFKSVNEDYQFRFLFSNIRLIAEHLRIDPKFYKAEISRTLQWSYDGVVRILKTENIPASALNYTMRAQNVLMPEGFFIFAIPSDVIAGTYKYSTNTTGNIFNTHNLKSVSIQYGGQNFFMKDLNIGTFQNDIMELKLFVDYLTDPPFGMKVDRKKITMAGIKDGCKDTVMPHVWLKYSNYLDKTRIVPFLSDGTKQDERRDMDINFAFNTGGATTGVTYCIYLYYCETNLILNTKKKSLPFFHSPFVTLI